MRRPTEFADLSPVAQALVVDAALFRIEKNAASSICPIVKEEVAGWATPKYSVGLSEDCAYLDEEEEEACGHGTGITGG